MKVVFGLQSLQGLSMIGKWMRQKGWCVGLEEETVDKVKWRLTNTGVFTVKSIYNVLQSCIVEAFPW